MNLHCSNLETVLDWSGVSGGVGIMKIWEGAMHPTVGDSHPLCKVHAMRTKGEGRTGRDNKMDVYPATPPAPPRFGNTTAQAPSETLTHLQRWTTMVLATAYKSRMGHFLVCVSWNDVSGGVEIMEIWEGVMHPTVVNSHPFCNRHQKGSPKGNLG